MNLGLAGKACVVNGGSRGIGLETAKMLCAEDAAVLLLARGEEALRSAADECAAPGGLADQAAERRGVSREEALDAQRSRVPIGRYATAEEIASVVVFLCSERASYVAGAAWSADGGVVQVII